MKLNAFLGLPRSYIATTVDDAKDDDDAAAAAAAVERLGTSSHRFSAAK